MGKQGELRLGSTSKNQLDGGICYYDETTLDLSQSPYGGLLNMCLDDGGMPVKRQGQASLFESLGDGGINGIFTDFKDTNIIAWKDALYTFNGGATPTKIYTGINNEKVFMFAFNGILYILDGSKYLKYDGKEVKEVEPYIPRIVMNRRPDGSESVVDESWNMLGAGFKTTFNGDGTAKEYKLSLDNLDSKTVTCNVNGTEGNGFTVNRSTGVVTFNTAPAKGTNNVEIIAYKSQPKNVSNIIKCKFGCEFSNRIFLGGNSEQPNFYFVSGLTDANDITYFPEKYKYSIGGSDKAVTGFKVHYNKLVVFKENCTCTVTSSTGLDGTASFPIEFLNTEVGCDMPNTIQLINNNVVFCNTYGGVHCIVSTVVPGEKNIVPISQNVNGSYERPGLLFEDKEAMKKASSVDFANKYYLNINGIAYVLDYKDVFNVNDPKKNRWFIYDNIYASNFAIMGGNLIYGHSRYGMVCTFITAFNDFGASIRGIWKSKLLDFGYPDYLKLISDIWYTCRSNVKSEVMIRYYDDEGTLLDTIDIPSVKAYGWNSMNWSNWDWHVQIFAPTIRKKIRLRNIRYFQIEFSNYGFNENLSILGLVIKYSLTKQVR